MGYFNALTSSSFKTTSDGRRLFFPWGLWGRGYVIGSEPEYNQLWRRVKTYLVAAVGTLIVNSIAAGVVAGVPALQVYPAGLVVATVATVLGVFYIAFYIAWVPYLIRGLQPSPERLTLRDSVANQAREHSTMMLWTMEFVSIGVVGGGMFLLVSRPAMWPVATAGIVFFGLGAALFARMLIVRKRA
jgi:hypothetical protein